MPRLFRRLAGVLLALAVLYLVAGNLFLNTPLGSWAINRKPERFQLEWSRGFTAWPGHVVLWNVELKGHVRHVQWSAQAKRAKGRITILPLFSRELRLPWVEADEVSATIDRVDEEMTPPPAREGGWLMRFERIFTTSPRHLRAGAFDIDLRGQASFAFTKQLRGGPLEVLPSTAALTDLRVAAGKHVLLREGTLDARFAIARHRREEAPGLARLGLADGELRLGGRTPSLSADLGAGGQWHGVIVDDGAGGRLDANLAFARGALAPQGAIDLRLPLHATRGAAQLDDEAVLHLGVVEEGLDVNLRLPPPPGDSGEVRGQMRVTERDLRELVAPANLLAKTSGTLDIDWHFASLEWLTPLLVKAPWLQLEGAGRVDAALKIANGRLEPGSHARVPEVELVAVVGGYRFGGRAHANGTLTKGTDDQRASVTLELDRYDIADADQPSVRLVHGKGLRIDLDAGGDLRDFRESAKTRLRFADAHVPDLRPLNAWLPGDALDIASGNAQVGSDLELDSEGRITRGRITLAARKMRARFGAATLGGDFDLDARIGGSDLKSRHFDLDGSKLTLRNLSLPDDERAAGRTWWAEIVAERARIEASRPFRLDAEARIGLQDIGLLLALYTRHRDYPAWVLGLLDAGRVDARGAVRIDGRRLLLDRVAANNNRFDVKARLHVDRANPRGDLLLGWRKLALGLELDGKRREFHLRRAREWFADRPALIPAR
ncbi:hypothetical protein [Dokdonella sp.]|uniref:hypothetical protein n=1 Tax=Dokdonella sp. TaxID=2291710 RepID=UPI0025C5F84E|nr:hypothetical protein [Dokdonella sp.]MBX3691588.1 hypothetical protein [Dokdonella sp.]MCW5567706.1 hypothetical protein [Dokdonella sp.]